MWLLSEYLRVRTIFNKRLIIRWVGLASIYVFMYKQNMVNSAAASRENYFRIGRYLEMVWEHCFHSGAECQYVILTYFYN